MKFNKQDYEFMELAKKEEKKSLCSRTQVGVVFVKNGQVIKSSFNGQLNGGAKTCAELGGCIRDILKIKHGENMSVCFAPCAETRGICEAARDGISLKGATVYCTKKPCIICTRNLAAAEVEKVIYLEDYPDPDSARVAQITRLPIILMPAN
jgi:dCMP deaminase